jgi:hypothetical protein
MIDLFATFTTRLESAGITYMVTGSVAAMIYGEPRLTHDVDLVIALDAKAAAGFAALFPDEDFYCPPVEVLELEAQRGLHGHFNVIEHRTGFKADVYLVGRDPLHRWALDRVRVLQHDGLPLRVAPPEYVILRKLEFLRDGGSERHIRDIQGMLRHIADDLDVIALDALVKSRGLAPEWDRARRG